MVVESGRPVDPSSRKDRKDRKGVMVQAQTLHLIQAQIPEYSITSKSSPDLFASSRLCVSMPLKAIECRITIELAIH